MKKIGLIEVYTGEGKGKTTASIGLAIRAKAHNFKVCYISFHKNPSKFKYAEQNILKKLKIDVFCFSKKHPFCDKIDFNDLRKDCLLALEFIREKIYPKGYDLLILDEINISLRDGFLKEDEVISLLKDKPKNLEIVLTGRGCPSKIIELADLVSEIKKIKHPFDKNIKAKRGIEF